MKGKRFGFLGIKFFVDGSYRIYRTREFLTQPKTDEETGIAYRWIYNIRENYSQDKEQQEGWGAWIVPEQTSGPWVGHEQEIAIWNRNHWEFFKPETYDAVFVYKEEWMTVIEFEEQIIEVVTGFFFYDGGKWRRFEKIETKQVWIEDGRDDYGIPFLTMGGIVSQKKHDTVIGVVNIGNEEINSEELLPVKRIKKDDKYQGDSEYEGETIRVNEDKKTLFIMETEACRKTEEDEEGNEEEIRPPLATTDGVIKSFTTEDTETVTYKEVDMVGTRGGKIIFIQTTDDVYTLDGKKLALATTDGYLAKFSCEDAGWIVQVVTGKARQEQGKRTDVMEFTNAL